MQFINKNVHGRQAVGHIDLLGKFSYIEVPEKDAAKVMKAHNGATYKKREVRCNDAEEGGHGAATAKEETSEATKKLTSVVLIAPAKNVEASKRQRTNTPRTGDTGGIGDSSSSTIPN